MKKKQYLIPTILGYNYIGDRLMSYYLSGQGTGTGNPNGQSGSGFGLIPPA